MKLILILDGLGDTARPSPLRLADTAAFRGLKECAMLYRFRAFADETFCPRSDDAFTAFLGIEAPSRGALEALGDGLGPPLKTGFKCVFAEVSEGDIVKTRKPHISSSAGHALVEELSVELSNELTFAYEYDHRFSAACAWNSDYSNDPETDGEILQVKGDDMQMEQISIKIRQMLSNSSLAQAHKINCVLFRLPGSLQKVYNAARYAIISDNSVICGIGIGCGFPTFRYSPATPIEEMVDFILKLQVRTVVLHYDSTDEASHAGDFNRKIAEIEKADNLLDNLREHVSFSTIIITGDHPTPCESKVHSSGWSPCLVWGHGGGVIDFSDEAAETQPMIVGEELLTLL